MKRLSNYILFIFLLFISLLISSEVNVEAKVSSSSVFEVSVGNDDVLPVYYFLENNNNQIKEKVEFLINLKGLSENSNTYEWTHTFCYDLGNGEICEVDVDNTIKSDDEYISYFYDSDMEYYSDSLTFEYVTFKNSFKCLECVEETVINLSDITFTKENIDYSFISLLDGNIYEHNTYIGPSTEFLFKNNVNSSYSLVNAYNSISPKYKIVNDICVDGVCKTKEYNSVSSNGSSYYMSPYVGNLYFTYDLSEFTEIAVGDTVSVKTTLLCTENCTDSRRGITSSKVLYEGDFTYNDEKVELDGENTFVTPSNTSNYIKEISFKVTGYEGNVGLYDEGLKYYLIEPIYSNSCSYGYSSQYLFENGKEIKIGEGLNGKYCLYYEVVNNLGDTYTSDYYVYYFDNSAPVIDVKDNYESDGYYNEITGIILTGGDSYSGVKEVYYYWSKNSEEDYLNIKEYGELYEGSISLTKEGSFYLYILGYDYVGNYTFINAGLYNLDLTPLSKGDLSVEVINQGNNYSNNLKIKVDISEQDDEYSFKCGFASSINDYSELVNNCKNGEYVTVPSGYEGVYSFYVYVNDKAGNYSLLEVKDNLKIDTVAPSVNYSALYNDDSYHLVNEITLNIDDISGVNNSSLKYGWFLKEISVTRTDLVNTFTNNSIIGYPVGCYGEYKLYVSALDNLGNETFTSFDKVFKIDTDVINISLNGEEKVVILRGEEYVELGANAYKGSSSSGVRVSEIIVTGKVDSNKKGTYYITYSSGEGDLLVSVTREVIVKDDTSYIIAGVSMFLLGLGLISLRLFIKRKKS